jgi:hypothetical protein
MRSVRRIKWLSFGALMLALMELSSCGGDSGGTTVRNPYTVIATPSATPTATPQPATGEGLLPGFITTD